MQVLAYLFGFRGRASRTDFWLITFGWTMLCLCVSLYYVLQWQRSGQSLDYLMRHIPAPLIAVQALCFLGTISVSVRRWHDRNKSGVWVFVVLIPLIGPFWSLLELGFMPPRDEDNEYGPPPGQTGTGGVFGAGSGELPEVAINIRLPVSRGHVSLDPVSFERDQRPGGSRQGFGRRRAG